MAAHLRAGSRYLVQLELRNAADPWDGVRDSVWERERDGVRVETHWRVTEIDLESGWELQHGSIRCLSGPEAGRVIDEVHQMAAWTPQAWADAIEQTPFTYSAVYDGDQEGRPKRAVGTYGRLLWHELVAA